MMNRNKKGMTEMLKTSETTEKAAEVYRRFSVVFHAVKIYV